MKKSGVFGRKIVLAELMQRLYLIIVVPLITGCISNTPGDLSSGPDTSNVIIDSSNNLPKEDHTIVSADTILPVTNSIRTGQVQREELVAYAKSLIGVPYKYASTDPAEGFDCSGFITYVFNHFNIAVPRSSVDFTNVGMEVKIDEASAGDLILFTGTDSTDRTVGHMGIIVSNGSGKTEFIHSTSGKAYSVVITALERYYRSRFVKVIRVFPG